MMLIRLLIGLRRASSPVDDAAILQLMARHTKALALHITPPIAWCKHVVVPTVVGVLRPTILLPITFTTGMTPRQIEAILTH